MLVWRLNLEWKSGHPDQCLRLGNHAKTDRALRVRFRESASYGSALRAVVMIVATLLFAGALAKAVSLGKVHPLLRRCSALAILGFNVREAKC